MVDKKIIKAELIKRGMTYNDLAKKLGISVSTLGNKMNSRSAFTIDELAIIADTFNKEITFFLNISVIK
ncbi:MAG TPA: helix-turn-helix transcriptional regulator [Edaphocola sp.]|nr:helix-turn-helix transcriptional regulator [Edaphocola sp.]